MAQGSMAACPRMQLASEEEGRLLAARRHKVGAWTETKAFAGLAVSAVGHGTGDDAGVIVYVSKGSAKALRSVPEEIDGVPITVRKIGLITINPERAGKVTGDPKVYLKGNRIACGSSCATGGAGAGAGTFGAIVTKGDDEALYLLSNNHVIAGCNQIPPGMPILSPAALDAKPGGQVPITIATVSEAVPMLSGDPHHVKPCEEDVAIGLISDGTKVSSWQGDDDGFDTPTTIVEPELSMRVKKVGRTTGLTIATIDSKVSDPYPIPCNVRGFRANIWFKNFWCLLATEAPFALPGDSGSLVVTEDGRGAVGILFSSTPTGEVGHMIPFSHVAKKLGIKLRSGHGI